MATTLRVFDVEPSKPGAPHPKPTERPAVYSLEEKGDAAKRKARENLVGMNLQVRSISWAPTPVGEPELIAYVTKRS